jgi:hypothetical protein
MRRMRYVGPGAVLVTVAHIFDEGSRRRRWRRGRSGGLAGRAPIGRPRVALREPPQRSGDPGGGPNAAPGVAAGGEQRAGKVIALAPNATLKVG